jgi:hypothetical protein
MAISGCGFSAHCCQPAVAGGFIYAALRGELSTHLAPPGFVYSEFSSALSPFQALGEMTLHPLSQAGVFVYSSHGKWVFPPLLWSFPPSATFTSFHHSCLLYIGFRNSKLKKILKRT